jgi:hypothetical protein
MKLRGIARNAVRAFFICAVAVLLTGCPLRIQGDITTKTGGQTGSGTGTIEKGTWCCKNCGGGGGSPLKCTGCTVVAAGSTATSCPSAGGGPTILVDCPGTTTSDIGGNVTCY